MQIEASRSVVVDLAKGTHSESGLAIVGVTTMGGSAVTTITAFTTPTRFDTGTASGRRTQAAVATRSLTGDGTVSATAAIDPASDWIVHLLLVRA